MKKDKKKRIWFVKDFFDIYKYKHIVAFDHLRKHGAWPVGFIPDNVEIENNWHMLLFTKMANAFVDGMLESGEE